MHSHWPCWVPVYWCTVFPSPCGNASVKRNISITQQAKYKWVIFVIIFSLFVSKNMSALHELIFCLKRLLMQLWGPNFSQKYLFNIIGTCSLFKVRMCKMPFGLFRGLIWTFDNHTLQKCVNMICVFSSHFILFQVLSYYFMSSVFNDRYNLVYTVLCSTVNEFKVCCVLEAKSSPVWDL